ncbi:peptide chain release factor N(5)-glutamine methyltransferase [Blautia luti]|uniref:peptide chain release factor N(5)-glutamine methyltransferase n=1 Tax=Blautia luti TaxID=89014 RepID=UPI0018AA16C4|nr:peptide chain release factor N(5)-glutamine methyltransferase [Blautia luti]
MSGETLNGLLKNGQKILEQSGIREAGLDAWLLLEYITGKSRAYYFAHGDEGVTEETACRYQELIRKRAEHIPLQHLTHQAFFMGYEFYVNEDVLVPRQDTETLMEAALELLKGNKAPRILDMCTGSGCIITSLMLEVPEASGTGVDLSEKALEVAIRNARELGTADRTKFVKSDLFSAEYFSKKDNAEKVTGYDMLISNPPYIPSGEIEGLMEEVRLHDPRMALDGMEDGLYFYREITRQAMDHIRPGGWLLYEIGCEQGKDVKELLEKEGFIKTEIRQDLCGLDRVVLGQRPLLQEEKYV